MYLKYKKRIIVAMDFPSYNEAVSMAKRLDPKLCRLKVGKELFTASGPAIVKDLMGLGFEIFLDLKYHDIPNTVAKAVRVATDLGVWMVSVHTLGGERVLRTVVDSISGIEKEKQPLIIGVTILTSMSVGDMKRVGISLINENGIEDSSLPMIRLARLAKDFGLDGVVCSGQEVSVVRQVVGDNFVLVTPGIRLSDGSRDDQKRVATPEVALKNGANYLVIGRPITEATDPLAVLQNFNQCINATL